tara:strand:- start:2922 stop:3098 length:177 start_codon:yes stop_codon:yes gene_type:complete
MTTLAYKKKSFSKNRLRSRQQQGLNDPTHISTNARHIQGTPEELHMQATEKARRTFFA